jgi:hypothetical protein
MFLSIAANLSKDLLKSHCSLKYESTKALNLFSCCCLCILVTVSSIFKNDGRDSKQIVPVHNSQVMALSQVFPNNLNGGVLT